MSASKPKPLVQDLNVTDRIRLCDCVPGKMVNHLSKWFSKFEIGSSGQISVVPLGPLCYELGLEITQNMLAEVPRQRLVGEDDRITFEDFFLWWCLHFCEHAETLDLSPVPKRLLSPPSSWQAQDSGSDIEDAIVNFELEKLLAAELDKLLVPESAPAPEPAPDGSVLHTPPRARSRSPRRATESGSKSSHQ